VDGSTAAAREYVALALRLARLVPALVDAAPADPALCRAVAAEPLPRAADLVRQAGRLVEALPDAGLPSHQELFLVGQLRAVEWRARRLAGQAVPFHREVRECLGVVAERGEPDAYRAAHRILESVLPGTGPLTGRMAAHRRADAVPRDRLGSAIRALSAALRTRVAPRFALPEDESVEHVVVDDAPWSALHTYRGGHRSVVRFSATATSACRLPRLVAHETYPGHHTECVRAARSGRAELLVAVMGTPQTVLSEGLAEGALDAGVGQGWGVWAAVLAQAGLHVDAAGAERLDAARTALRRVRLDAALLLHAGPRRDVEGAEAHLRRWLLLDAGRARRVVDALARPMWRTQVVASVEGADLVRRRIGRPGADAAVEHLRLLDDPCLLTSLRV
jgi:hypothetical protein